MTKDESMGDIRLIKCPDCGKDVSLRASVCPNCGCPISKGKGGKKKVSARILIRGAAFGVIALVMFCLVAYVVAKLNSPLSKMERCLDKNQIAEAQSILNQKIKDSEEKKKAQKIALSSLDRQIDAYFEDEGNQEKYKAVLDFVHKNFKDADTTKAEKRATDIQSSKKAYASAEKAMKSEEYGKALNYYKNVAEEDGLYSEAQSKMKDCRAGIKRKLTEEIDAQLNSKEPSLASVREIMDEEDSLKEDSDIVGKVKELEKKVTEYTVNQAKELSGRKKYLEAFGKLNQVPQSFRTDQMVREASKGISSDMVKWATASANGYIKKKQFERAEDLLYKYKAHDTGDTLSSKLSAVRKRAKKYNIAKFKKLKSQLTIKYDSMDKAYEVVNKGYSTKYINVGRNINIEARAMVYKGGKYNNFHLLAGFTQDEWIFTDIIKFSAGKKREAYAVSYTDRYTDVGYGQITEWMYIDDLDQSLSPDMDKLVPEITTSKKTVIRFSGDGNGSRNHVITNKEKNNIKVVKRFCDMLDKYDYLYKYI